MLDQRLVVDVAFARGPGRAVPDGPRVVLLSSSTPASPACVPLGSGAVTWVQAVPSQCSARGSPSASAARNEPDRRAVGGARPWTRSRRDLSVTRWGCGFSLGTTCQMLLPPWRRWRRRARGTGEQARGRPEAQQSPDQVRLLRSRARACMARPYVETARITRGLTLGLDEGRAGFLFEALAAPRAGAGPGRSVGRDRGRGNELSVVPGARRRLQVATARSAGSVAAVTTAPASRAPDPTSPSSGRNHRDRPGGGRQDQRSASRSAESGGSRPARGRARTAPTAPTTAAKKQADHQVVEPDDVGRCRRQPAVDHHPGRVPAPGQPGPVPPGF